MRDIEQIQRDQLEILKARLTAEGIPFTEGTTKDVHKCLVDDDPCLIVRGWAVNYDRWGFTMDSPGRAEFFDNGDLEELMLFMQLFAK